MALADPFDYYKKMNDLSQAMPYLQQITPDLVGMIRSRFRICPRPQQRRNCNLYYSQRASISYDRRC